MKSLVESINESLLTDVVLTILLPAICLAEAVYHNLFTGQAENADHSIKGLIAHDGVVLGFIEWIFERFGDLQELLEDKRIRKEMDRIEASPEFKEYLKLPKSKRTLKKLREIGKNANLKDSYAIIQLWDEFKSGKHISDKDLKNEIG